MLHDSVAPYRPKALHPWTIFTPSITLEWITECLRGEVEYKIKNMRA